MENNLTFRFFKLKWFKLKKYLIINFKLIKRNLKLKWEYERKKNLIKWSVITILFLLAFLSLRNKIQIIDKSTHTKELIIVDTINTLDQFLYQLRYIESRNNHKARRNQYVIIRTSHGLDTVKAYSQYIGYYQMGRSARKAISMDNISDYEYWNNPKLQHKSMILWLIYLKKDLDKQINEWDGKFFGSFYITESGILAMSHLVGNNRVKRWLKSRNSLRNAYSNVDGNGKKGTDYLQQLGRYNLNLDKFILNDGNVNYEYLDEYIDRLMKNEISTDDLIINLNDTYVTIDSVDYVQDSLSLKKIF
jgi:hypothetical protein